MPCALPTLGGDSPAHPGPSSGPNSCSVSKALEDTGLEAEDEKRRARSHSAAGLPSRAITRGGAPGENRTPPENYILATIHLHLHAFIEQVPVCVW